MSDAAPSPTDLELRKEIIKLRCGKTVVASELTLRMRDALGAYLRRVRDSGDVSSALESVLRQGGEMDLNALVSGVLGAVGSGALSGLVAVLIDGPENRELLAQTPAAEWVLDNVRMGEEAKILSAVVRVNDVPEYVREMGNVLKLARAPAPAASSAPAA